MVTGFHTPRSPQEAVNLIAELGDGAWFLGGGTELNSLAAPPGRQEHLISLSGLDLDSIEATGDEIVVGASCTLQAVLESEEIPPIVKEACRHVKNRAIRNQATIGGHIAAGHAYASVLPILVALDAEVDVMKADGTASRDPLLHHVGNPQRTLITALRIPRPPSEIRAAVNEHCRSAIDLAMLTVAVAYRLEGGAITAPAIVVGGLSRKPRRLSEIEKQLEGGALPAADTVVSQVAQHVEAEDGPRASAEFKRYMAGALVARCLAEVAS